MGRNKSIACAPGMGMTSPTEAGNGTSSRAPRVADGEGLRRTQLRGSRHAATGGEAEDGPGPERLLNNRQAAALLGIAVPTFYAMLKARELPPAYYVRPYTPRWKASELLAAVERSRGYPDQMKGHARSAKILQETRS